MKFLNIYTDVYQRLLALELTSGNLGVIIIFMIFSFDLKEP